MLPTLRCPTLLVLPSLFLFLLPSTTHSYIIYEDPDSSTKLQIPSVPSITGPPFGGTSMAEHMNLFLGPIGNLHLCDPVRFYNLDGNGNNLRGTAAATSTSTDTVTSENRPTETVPLALLLERGGGCTSAQKVRNAVSLNSVQRSLYPHGSTIRYLVVYDNEWNDSFAESDPSLSVDREDEPLDCIDGLRVLYLTKTRGTKLHHFILDYGKRAHPTIHQYPPFLLTSDAFAPINYSKRSVWEFHVEVDGAKGREKPWPRKRPVKGEVGEELEGGVSQPDL